MEQAEIGNNEHVVRLLEVHNSCSLNIVFGFFFENSEIYILGSAPVSSVCTGGMYGISHCVSFFGRRTA